MEKTPKQLYITVLVIVIVVAIAGLIYWKQKTKEKILGPAKASTPAVSGTLPSINTETNVLKDVPVINPVDKANPFKDIYKNPFE
ncbi:MAG: hypothetical protein HYY55_00950 [Candidatus Niyogibacteria bacterium]|nr:MAG: hypothetical protein HYY55_00950 [Candidatus Niyogibacteria bacterium]